MKPEETTKLKVIETLLEGSHSPNSKMCVMEAVAYVAGETWSDRPDCVSPIIGEFLRNWNDSLPANEDRVRLLAPLILLVLGTLGSQESESKRSWMAFDWLVRGCGPAFMDLTESLKPHAKALRDLGSIFDDATWDAAKPTIQAARKASNAAWAAAAGADACAAAAGAAARAAARAAAAAAAGAAACAAAWTAAAVDVAWAAAWAAAAVDAAGAALAPTVLALQQSAQDLVKRMADIERVEFKVVNPLQIGEMVIS